MSVLTVSLFLVASISIAGCTTLPVSTGTKEIRDAFNFEIEEGWIVPKRPDALWSVGQIVEINDDGYALTVDSLANLDNCLPVDDPQIGPAPDIFQTGTYTYNVSLTAALGIPESVLNSSGLDGDHKSTVSLNDVSRTALRLVPMETYIRNYYSSDMSDECKFVLKNSKRFFITEAIMISSGDVTLIDSRDATIDLSSDTFKVLSDAAISYGNTVTREGKLTIKKPIPVAFRLRSFDNILEIEEPGYSNERPSASEVYDMLLNSRFIVDDSKPPLNISQIAAGIGGAAVLLYLLTDDDPPKPPTGDGISLEIEFPE